MTEADALRVILEGVFNEVIRTHMQYPERIGKIKDVFPTYRGATWDELLEDPIGFVEDHHMENRTTN